MLFRKSYECARLLQVNTGCRAAYYGGNLSSQDVYGFIVCSYYLKTSIHIQFHKALHVK